MATFRDPAFVLAYGPSKIGKTTDLLYSFPAAFFMAPPGALKPAVNVVGFEIPPANIADPQTVPEATALIIKVGQTRKFTEVGCDDFSLLAERSFSVLEKKFSGYKLWGALRDEILDFRDAARRVGMHMIINTHEKGPAVVNGCAQRGGPKLPGRLPEEVPAACDLVLRATVVSDALGATGKLGWKGVYRCSPSDPGFISGDRHGVTPDMAPMNLGEILRAAGYGIKRAPGLEWMDDAVRNIATVLYKNGPLRDTQVIAEGAKWLAVEEKHPLLHVRWALRDAMDRTTIARAMANPLAMFGV